MFKTQKEWLAFLTGKKWVRSDTAAIYHFINPIGNEGFNLKITWKGKIANTKAEFKTLGAITMLIDGQAFAITKFEVDKDNSQLFNKHIIYTIYKEKEVTFSIL